MKGELFLNLAAIKKNLESVFSDRAEKKNENKAANRKANKTYRLACKFSLDWITSILEGGNRPFNRPPTSKMALVSQFQTLAKEHSISLTDGEIINRFKRYSLTPIRVEPARDD